jgi:hypothetical protein
MDNVSGVRSYGGIQINAESFSQSFVLETSNINERILDASINFLIHVYAENILQFNQMARETIFHTLVVYFSTFSKNIFVASVDPVPVKIVRLEKLGPELRL